MLLLFAQVTSSSATAAAPYSISADCKVVVEKALSEVVAAREAAGSRVGFMDFSAAGPRSNMPTALMVVGGRDEQWIAARWCHWIWGSLTFITDDDFWIPASSRDGITGLPVGCVEEFMGGITGD